MSTLKEVKLGGTIMAKLSYIKLFVDYKKQFDLLSNEELGEMMRAIFSYAQTGETPNLTGAAMMCFSFIQTQLDRDEQEYQQKCESNKQNARKRWEKEEISETDKSESDNISTLEDTSVYEGIREYTNDTKTKTKTKIKTKTEKEKIKKEKALVLFERFWEAYPKKTAKLEAEKAFIKLNVNDGLLDTMLTALEKQSSQWQQVQYIPYPATWLNGKRWNDELEPMKVNKLPESYISTIPDRYSVNKDYSASWD